MLLGKTGIDNVDSVDILFFLFLDYFITFLLYLYISSSVDKSDDSIDRIYRLDIVGVRGSDLKVLLEVLDGVLKRLLANCDRERDYHPHEGNNTLSLMTPSAEKDRPVTTFNQN